MINFCHCLLFVTDLFVGPHCALQVKTSGLERQDQFIHWFYSMTVQIWVSGEYLRDERPQMIVQHLGNVLFSYHLLKLAFAMNLRSSSVASWFVK